MKWRNRDVVVCLLVLHLACFVAARPSPAENDFEGLVQDSVDVLGETDALEAEELAESESNESGSDERRKRDVQDDLVDHLLDEDEAADREKREAHKGKGKGHKGLTKECRRNRRRNTNTTAPANTTARANATEPERLDDFVQEEENALFGALVRLEQVRRELNALEGPEKRKDGDGKQRQRRQTTETGTMVTTAKPMEEKGKGNSHGKKVSEMARSGAEGQKVSEVARSKNKSKDATTQAPAVSGFVAGFL